MRMAAVEARANKAIIWPRWVPRVVCERPGIRILLVKSHRGGSRHERRPDLPKEGGDRSERHVDSDPRIVLGGKAISRRTVSIRPVRGRDRSPRLAAEIHVGYGAERGDHPIGCRSDVGL